MNFRELYFEQVPMTRQQVMDYLQIGKNTLTHFMNHHGLPYIKMENRLRFWKKDIDEWLNSRRVNSQSVQQGTSRDNQGQIGTQQSQSNTKTT